MPVGQNRENSCGSWNNDAWFARGKWECEGRQLKSGQMPPQKLCGSDQHSALACRESCRLSSVLIQLRSAERITYYEKNRSCTTYIASVYRAGYG